MLRNYNSQEFSNKLDYSEIKSAITTKFQHMKSVLGHISIVDGGDSIIPVPIFCICFSKDNEIIFTGDNNGLIKVWSTKTGGLIEVFKQHEKAINDMIVVNSFLISCSEDKTVCIWNIKTLKLVQTICLDEAILRVIDYKYIFHGKDKDEKEDRAILIITTISGVLYTVDLDAYTGNELTSFDQIDKGDKNEVKRINIFISDEDYSPVSKFYFDKKIIEKYELKKIKKFQIASMTVNSGGLLICGFFEGIVCIWDLNKILNTVINQRKFLYDFEKYILFLEYVHTNTIQICDFNKSGKNFFTASLDGNVNIWKTQDEVIEKLRLKNSSAVNRYEKDYQYPVYILAKMSEDENTRNKCSVNATCWSCSDSYVISIISSRLKKRLQSDNNEFSNKRTSAILIFDKIQNSVIRKFNNENGFDLHDECYVLEPHPKIEEIILTVVKTNEITIINFITRQIIGKFIEENYFFSNITQNMIALEGRFDSSGESFVVSTWLGSISIFSVHSKSSYSGTYMHQFFENETQNNSTYISFPKFCNMFFIPYTIQQPHSKYRYEAFELQLQHQLSQDDSNLRNLLCKKLPHEQNLEERIYECQKEEEIHKDQCRENLAYMLQEPDEPPSDPSNIHESAEDSVNFAEEFVDEESMNDILSLDKESYSKNSFIDDDSEVDGIIDYDYGKRANTKYSLRSKRPKNPRLQPSEKRRRGRPRIHGNTENTLSSNSRNIFAVTRANNINNMSTTTNRVSNNISHSSRYHTRNRRNLKEEDDVDTDEEYLKIIKPKEKKTKSRIQLRTENQKNSSLKTVKSNVKKHSLIEKLLDNCINVEDICYICKSESHGHLLGPFITQDYISFNHLENMMNQNANIAEYHNYYFHFNCLIKYNDFLVYETEEVDIQRSIKEVLSNRIICWRCEGENATKKCQFDACNKFFHGQYCLEKYCIELNQNLYCLDCYKHLSSKILSRSIRNSNTSVSIYPLKLINRDYFTKNTFSFYSYYPQLGDNVYFILQAYEDFFRENYFMTIFEVDYLFFWKKNPELFKRPSKFKIIDINFKFPNNQSIQLTSNIHSKENIQDTLSIIMYLTLKNQETNININLVFFQNTCPEFLIYSETYEKNKIMYERMAANNERAFDCVIEDTFYKVEKIKADPKEKNEFYQNSEFENIMTQSYSENEKTLSRISTWDIRNNQLINDNKVFKKFCDTLHKEVEEFYKKNSKFFCLFYNKVDPIKDEASEYYGIVPTPVYLSLILSRLKNYFYTNIISINFDIELLLKNAILYNKKFSEITNYAEKLVTQIATIIQNVYANNKEFYDVINQQVKVTFNKNLIDFTQIEKNLLDNIRSKDINKLAKEITVYNEIQPNSSSEIGEQDHDSDKLVISIKLLDSNDRIDNGDKDTQANERESSKRNKTGFRLMYGKNGSEGLKLDYNNDEDSNVNLKRKRLRRKINDYGEIDDEMLLKSMKKEIQYSNNQRNDKYSQRLRGSTNNVTYNTYNKTSVNSAISLNNNNKNINISHQDTSNGFGNHNKLFQNTNGNDNSSRITRSRKSEKYEQRSVRNTRNKAINYNEKVIEDEDDDDHMIEIDKDSDTSFVENIQSDKESVEYNNNLNGYHTSHYSTGIKKDNSETEKDSHAYSLRRKKVK